MAAANFQNPCVGEQLAARPKRGAAFAPPAMAALGIALVGLALMPPLFRSEDGRSMLGVAESLLERGSVAVPAALGVPGLHGLYYSQWYPLLSVIALPFVAVGLWLGRELGIQPGYAAQLPALALSVALFAGNAYFTALIALRLGATMKGAVAAAIAFAFGTIAPIYAREFFADPLLALLTALAIYDALDPRNGRIGWRGGAVAGLAILAKPTGIVLAPCLAAYNLLTGRRRSSVVLPIAGAACGLLIYFAYNFTRFGNPMQFGQGYRFSLGNAPLGMLGLIVSPGHGIVWYCPVVLALAALSRATFRRSDVRLIVAIAVSYWLVYSLWSDWPGDVCWGARLMFPVLPGAVALTGLLERTRLKLLALLTVVGLVVSLPNFVSYYDRYYAEESRISESTLVWNPLYAPLVGVWPSAYRELRAALAPDVNLRHLVRNAGRDDNLPADEAPSNRIVALWWWMLPVIGIPRIAGIVVSLGFVLCGLLAIGYAFSIAAPRSAEAVQAAFGDDVAPGIGGI